MRIITGEYKGRRLYAPDNDDIRPTSDKVKEALFSMIAFDLEEAVCVDLFAGTGNLGLEALSRGAGKCYFCDNSKEALNIIRKISPTAERNTDQQCCQVISGRV